MNTGKKNKWITLLEVNSCIKTKTIELNPTSIKLIRFSAFVNWQQWKYNYYGQTKVCCSFSKCHNFKNVNYYLTWIPQKESLAKELILSDKKDNNPTHLKIDFKYINRCNDANFSYIVPWTLKIEEYINV
jgi:hypothetical protein